MMNYEMFKEIVREKIKDYMPSEYGNAAVDILGVNKVNGKRDVLAVRKPEERLVPNLYLDDFYKVYKQCDDLEMTLRNMAEEYVEIAERSVDNVEIDMSQMKDRVTMMLVNTEQNKEMLADMPHREFQDLSVIYRYVVAQDEQGVASFKVTNAIMEQVGMTPEELFQCAAENTKKMFPPKIASMEDVMIDMVRGDGISDEMADEMAEIFGTLKEPKESMWLIGNISGVNGAVSMLYDENLQRLAEKMGTDLYIIPSSVHEVLAVSVEMGSGNPEELAEMVQQINMSAVELEDRLSNNVYHYDKDLRQLKLATQVLDQRLDGVVAETELIYSTEPKR